MAQEKPFRILLWLVAIGFFMETLDSTIVSTALPGMAKSLNTSPLLMQSVIIAYSLTIAVLIPASGYIADRFGTKKTYFCAILGFSLGSILCAASHSLGMLVFARVIQGLGGSMLMPIGRLAVLRAFPREKFLQAISFVTVPALIGPLLGPTLGGWLVQVASWHWIFLINIPIGLIGCFATYYYMPDSAVTLPQRFDFRGFILLVIAMVSVSLAVDGLAELGFQLQSVLLLIALGLACIGAYIWHATHSKNPLFSLELFKIETYRVGLIGNLFSRIGSSGMPFLIPVFLQVAMGYTPFQAGLTMLPLAAAALVSKRFAPKLITQIGYRKFLTTNTILVGFAMASFSFISRDEPEWLRLTQLIFFGAVNSLQFTAMNTITLKDLDERASSGNSLFSMVQMLAMSLGVATAAALLTGFTHYYAAHTGSGNLFPAFRASFACIGLVTCSSAFIFSRLKANFT